MEVLGSVRPDEVPEGRDKGRPGGVWADLARRAIAECEKGRVLQVRVADNEERKRMRNGMGDLINKAGYSRQFTTVPDGDGLVVYLRLVPKQTPPSVVTTPIGRPRRRRAS